MFKIVEPVCNGSLVFDSTDKIKKITMMLLKMHNIFLTDAGQTIKAKVQAIQHFIKKDDADYSLKSSDNF